MAFAAPLNLPFAPPPSTAASIINRLNRSPPLKQPPILSSSLSSGQILRNRAPIARAVEESQESAESAAESGADSADSGGEVSDIGAEIKKAMAERKGEKEGDLLSGVAEEIQEIEWPAFGKVLRTTGVVLGVIAGSSVVLLTVNAVLAELSDRVFAGRGVQDFFS